MGRFGSDFSLFLFVAFDYPTSLPKTGLLGSNPSHALLIFFVLNFFLPGPVEKIAPILFGEGYYPF